MKAVDGISFDLDAGETFALVGESGCGKSTTARCVLRLIEPTSGSIQFEGEDITAARRRRLRELRREMQMIFQDPFASLNPRMTVRGILREPFRIHGLDLTTARSRNSSRWWGSCRSTPSRYPHEFSGGQRQRVGIARAIALEPEARRVRRAGVRPRRLHPGPGAQPAGGPAEAARADLPLHRPRPERGPPHRQPGGGDVPRHDRGDGADRRPVRAAVASLHPGAHLGRAGARPQPGAQPPAHPRSRATCPARSTRRAAAASAPVARSSPTSSARRSASGASTSRRRSSTGARAIPRPATTPRPAPSSDVRRKTVVVEPLPAGARVPPSPPRPPAPPTTTEWMDRPGGVVERT